MRAGVLTGVLLAALGAWSLAAQQPSVLTLPVGGGAVATGDLNTTDRSTSSPRREAPWPSILATAPADSNRCLDLNGDGKADIITGNSGSGDLSIRFTPY